MRGVVEERKLGSGLVEGLLDVVTSAIAGLVSARDEQPPLLGSSSTSGHGLIEGLLPVVQCQNVELHGTSLSLSSGNRVVMTRVGNV
jgi:hypothetical protein